VTHEQRENPKQALMHHEQSFEALFSDLDSVLEWSRIAG